MKKVMQAISIFIASIVFLAAGSIQDIIKKADSLREEKKYQEVLEVLKEAEKIDPENSELLWRLARAHFDLADQNPEGMKLQKEHLYPGFEYAKKCIELDPNSAGGHQYYAILIGRIGEIEGTKQKIRNSYEVKKHTLIAIKLDPKNDANYHVMGRWHYALSDLNWIEKKVAEIVYGKLPEASFEEAEYYFKKAHELAPDDPRHLLWLGKTQLELGKKEEAKASLQKAIEIKPKSES
ncbi:MAG TPA: tetratricopeptide repeat protein, partial [Candidatus Marinimicrobia bacterium]|nr:tetratricopeptide repeat protein [Candidatus Neomarinimicrobiota bacterium]